MDVVSEVMQIGAAGMRLQFTGETAETVRRMIIDGVRAAKGEQVTAAGEFTKGHYKRGVE